MAAVVGAIGTPGHQLALPLPVDILEHLDGGRNEWLAIFVRDPAGDDTASREVEVDPTELLALLQLDRDARLPRSPLSIREGDEPRLRGGDRVSPLGQLSDLVAPPLVGYGREPTSKLAWSGHDARPFHGRAGIGGHNPA